MINSSYIAHTAPLLVKHDLLHVHDMFRLKLLKFYYKLPYDLLPPYFITYSEVLTHNPPRELRHPYIHALLVKCIYSECSPLYLLIILINNLRHDENNTILRKITEKSHLYNGFAFNVTRCSLNTYDSIFRKDNCYVCRYL